MEERLLKWRLVLGQKSDPEGNVNLETTEQAGVDNTLEALYDSDRKGGLGPSSPSVSRWLGDIRKYFPSTTVQIMQRDALERLNLEQMLLEPELLETVEADVNLVATLLELNRLLPARTRETARQVVQKVVKKIEKKLRAPLQAAVKGGVHRATRNFRPRFNEIDWHQTILKNLRHYQPELKTVIPDQLIGYGRRRSGLRHVVLAVDQSGSMATSVVYASVLAAILASLNSLKTHIIAFDTKVVDLTERLPDPVDILFASQLGGGTDIGNALRYAARVVERPGDTILFLISDLFEGGAVTELERIAGRIRQSGVNFIALLALNDEGVPAFDRGVAGRLAGLGIPAFACTPDLFPDLLAAAIRRQDIRKWAAQKQVVVRN